MKYIKNFIILISLLSLTACSQEDFNKYSEENKIKEPTKEINLDKDIEFQTHNDPGKGIVLSHTNYNEPVKYFQYSRLADTKRYLRDTRDLVSDPSYQKARPYFDLRYVNPVFPIGGDVGHGKYTGFYNAENTIGTSAADIDPLGSLIQYSESDVITGGVTLNLYDAPIQNIPYGGLQMSFSYRVKNQYAWRDGYKNLMIQCRLNKPVYRKTGDNIGGSVSFVLFLYNKKLGQHLNYVIPIYSYGIGWTDEQKKMHFDPNTNTVHIASAIKQGTRYTTKSPLSLTTELVPISQRETNEKYFENLFRVNITYLDLATVLQELKANPPENIAGKNLGLSPEDWSLQSMALQYELEEGGGKASLSASFQGFEAIMSPLPL